MCWILNAQICLQGYALYRVSECFLHRKSLRGNPASGKRAPTGVMVWEENALREKKDTEKRNATHPPLLCQIRFCFLTQALNISNNISPVPTDEICLLLLLMLSIGVCGLRAEKIN